MNGIRDFSREEQISLYKEAIRLRKDHGWGKRRISKEIGVSENTVKGWLYHGYSTLNRINSFEIMSCYELGYVMGSVKGDGNLFFDKTKGRYGGYMVSLHAKDIDFLNEFNRCICILLNKNKPYTLVSQSKGKIRVECSCKGLYDYLRKPLDEHKAIIEASNETATGFLKAMFDGEGGAYYNLKQGKLDRPSVRCYNTNLELLEYIKQILYTKFGIIATISKLYDDGYTGSDGCVRKASYHIGISRYNDIVNFYRYIGFIIKRKQNKLEEIIKLKST